MKNIRTQIIDLSGLISNITVGSSSYIFVFLYFSLNAKNIMILRSLSHLIRSFGASSSISILVREV